mmetsp:Transcript_63798/g.183253  ORF Transcript_63798/g.183253 Transcript_63798/m.183253 type:complete len:330 (-) Transcript_63798:203-1192(-)
MQDFLNMLVLPHSAFLGAAQPSHCKSAQQVQHSYVVGPTQTWVVPQRRASGAGYVHACLSFVASAASSVAATRRAKRKLAGNLTCKADARGTRVAAIGSSSSSSSISGSSSRPHGSDSREYNIELFANERLMVSNLCLPPGASATFQHMRPTVHWQVGDGEHNLNGVRECVPDKHVSFVDGEAWCIRNEGPDDYRQMVFEILQRPHRSEEQVQQILAAAKYPASVGTTLLFENQWCRCWDFYLTPGESTNVHQHTMDYAFVCVAPSRLLGFHPNGSLAFDDISGDGQVRWVPTSNGGFDDVGDVRLGSCHSGRNGYDDHPMREYLIELK